MQCLIVVDGKNYSFNRVDSHPSKNEGWGTLLSRLGQKDQRLGHPPVIWLAVQHPIAPRVFELLPNRFATFEILRCKR